MERDLPIRAFLSLRIILLTGYLLWNLLRIIVRSSLRSSLLRSLSYRLLS
jgi:hypothetical protein